MKQIENSIIEIGNTLKTNVQLPINVNNKNKSIVINKIDFFILYYSRVSEGNKGLLLQEAKNLAAIKEKPIILFTQYIPSAIVALLITEKINYADISGNCYINCDSLYIHIEGRKIISKPKYNQSRAFQESGIKLLFCLLMEEENINRPYRELSQMAQISLGSVSAIIKELESLGFITSSNNNRYIKNKQDLLKRWIIAFQDTLRPRLLMKQMSFIAEKDYLQWANFSTNHFWWGGESGASLLTNELTPSKHTIYTDSNWQDVAKLLKLKPASDGNIEILQTFYSPESDSKNVPPLLIYADLIGSGDSRNNEVATIIFNNDLSYLK